VVPSLDQIPKSLGSSVLLKAPIEERAGVAFPQSVKKIVKKPSYPMHLSPSFCVAPRLGVCLVASIPAGHIFVIDSLERGELLQKFELLKKFGEEKRRNK